MSQLMQQITVTRIHERGDIVAFNTWVAQDKRLKVGTVVTIKDMGDYEWTIHHIYDTLIEMDKISINRGWDNNNYDKHESKSFKERKNAK